MRYEKTCLSFVVLGTTLLGLARGVFDHALKQADLSIPFLSTVFHWIVVAYVTGSVFALFAAAPEEKGRKTAIFVTWVYVALCVQSFFAFGVISPFLLLGYMLSTPAINTFFL